MKRWLVVSIAGAWLLAVLLGAVHAWAERHIINVDGVSYLEVADAYSRGDWKMAVNAYWSPLLSWLLGLAFIILRPSAYGEFAAAHLVSFGIYLGTVAAFSFLLRELIVTARSETAALRETGAVSLPEWSWIGLGYALFLWSSLWFIGLGIKPDLLVSAILYVAAGIMLRARRERRPLRSAALLGAVLGVGYLAKAFMLPIAFVCLIVAPRPAGQRSRLLCAAVSLLAFAAVSAPFVVALSAAKGSPTAGVAGSLNYAWYVNDVPRQHWQGLPPGSGHPTHAERQVFVAPAIYEFGTPIGGSYPPWYDPSYWYAGVSVHFNLREQVRVLVSHLRMYLNFFVFADLGSFAACAIVLLAAGFERGSLQDIARRRFLWLPPLAALALYALVHVERRFLGGFVLMFWMGLLGAVRLPDMRESRRLAAAVTIVVLMITGIRMSLLTIELMIQERSWTRHSMAVVAQGLKRVGLSQNDPVACIGSACWDHEWARLARMRIVAEIPPREGGGVSVDEQQFWAADPALRMRIMNALERTGARAVVASPPQNASLDGWRGLEGTGTFVYVLSAGQDR
jgi:hypothetical protein